MTMIEEGTVRDTFYNLMAELAISNANLTQQLASENGKITLTALAILEAMDRSANLNGRIRLLNDLQLSQDNCPRAFAPLAQGLLGLKAQIVLQDYEALKGAIRENPENHRLQPIIFRIKQMAEAISQRQEFRRIIVDVIHFCQEGTGLRRVRGQSAPSREGVTEELVRKSFYELMAHHALTSGCISKDALRDREAYIYLALSCHAIIEVIVQSRDLEGAIALLNNKALDLDNCPAAYRPLAEVIFRLKARVLTLTTDQVQMLKLTSCDEQVPPELLRYKTPQLMAIAGQINSVATSISQMQSFKNIIEQVIQFISS